MDNWQLLLGKVIDLGNLVAGLATNSERDRQDMLANTTAISKLSDDIGTIKGRLTLLETYRTETQDAAKTLLFTKPAERQNAFSLLAIIISAVATLLSAAGTAASIYISLHPLVTR